MATPPLSRTGALIGPRAAPGRPLRLFGLVHMWLRRARARRELAALDPAQMRDVGLDPHEVRREAEKPFWKP